MMPLKIPVFVAFTLSLHLWAILEAIVVGANVWTIGATITFPVAFWIYWGVVRNPAILLSTGMWVVSVVLLWVTRRSR